MRNGRWIGLSALLLILSFPPFDLGGLAWGALVPWLIALKGASGRQALRRSAAMGLLFFAGTIWWISYVTVPGLILLVAILALYFAAWGLLARRLLASPAPGSATLLGLPAAWAILEYARSILLSGFGWNLLAHTQWNWIRLIQIADLTGVYGISFLVVMVNVALYQVIVGRGSGVVRRWVPLGVALACLAAASLYGFLRLPGIGSLPQGEFRVAVTQGNIPQPEKWDLEFQETIWRRYEALTIEAAQRKPDLIVWPETAVPDYLDDLRVISRLKSIARRAGAALLVGAPFSAGERLFNGAALVEPEGPLRQRYDKIHRVPFGEYVPMGPLLGWLRRFVLMGNFSPGGRFTVFRPSDGAVAPFSVLVCFEDLFPGLCRRFAHEGARWHIVITNDAWFGRSAASLQHLQCSVFRAVENRIWIARAANNGWSGFISPAGVRTESIPRFVPGLAVGSLPIEEGGSLYTRWGDWFLLLCALLLGSAFLPQTKGYNKRFTPS